MKKPSLSVFLSVSTAAAMALSPIAHADYTTTLTKLVQLHVLTAQQVATETKSYDQLIASINWNYHATQDHTKRKALGRNAILSIRQDLPSFVLNNVAPEIQGHLNRAEIAVNTSNDRAFDREMGAVAIKLSQARKVSKAAEGKK